MATPKGKLTPQTRSRYNLPGSERAPFGKTPSSKKATGTLTVTVIVRPKTAIDPTTLGTVRLTRAQYNQQHGADPAAVKAVRSFAREFGLTVEKGTPAPGRRGIHLTGAVSAMQTAFGVQLGLETHEGGTYRVREGNIQLPDELKGLVEAVLGLDTRPQATSQFRVQGQPGQQPTAPPAKSPKSGAKGAPKAGGLKPADPGKSIIAHAAGLSYTPVQVAALYQFPQNASGAGQTIGLIELGGGYRRADLSAYFKSLGQAVPKVTAVPVDGGKNTPGTADGADGEVMLDIEVAASVAPGAAIAVYFAPNTDQGFIDAISTAVHDTTNKPGVISISWGGPESSWTQQSITALDQACQAAATIGVTITVAAGDNGSTDGGTGNNVDFPASSPHVLACGGTKLVGTGSTISTEVVWNELAASEGATGGGVSNVFPLPTWQSSSKVPAPTNSAGGRGVPDVAGNADPSTGYTIRVDGQTLVIGGTSAVAPLWAGLITVANRQNGTTAGFLNPAIYAANAKTGFRDITEGNNGAFSAGPGWDACTGLGSPIAASLISLLAAPASGKKPVKKPGKGKKKKSA